jgi:hypothetical protein
VGFKGHGAFQITGPAAFRRHNHQLTPAQLPAGGLQGAAALLDRLVGGLGAHQVLDLAERKRAVARAHQLFSGVC